MDVSRTFPEGIRVYRYTDVRKLCDQTLDIHREESSNFQSCVLHTPKNHRPVEYSVTDPTLPGYTVPEVNAEREIVDIFFLQLSASCSAQHHNLPHTRCPFATKLSRAKIWYFCESDPMQLTTDHVSAVP